MPATPGWLASIEALLNRNLDSTEAATALVRRLEGKSLQLEAAGFLEGRVAAVSGRLVLSGGAPPRVATPGVATPDAVISGSPAALLLLAADRGGGDGGRVRSVQVRGDAETAARFRDLFALARPDVEEEIARLIGDVAAHRLTRFAAGAVSWLRGGGRTAGLNVREYLEEESRTLVNGTELDEYLKGVDALREAADRAEARLARIERRLQATP